MKPAGRIAAIRGSTAYLTEPADAEHFRIGDVLALSYVCSDPPLRSGRLVVVAINREGGELLMTTPVYSAVATAVGHETGGDWIYRIAGEQ